MRAAKRDVNHSEIRDLLRAVPGMWVKDVGGYAGLGCDLIVRWQDGPLVCLEIKAGPKDPLTDSERELKRRAGPFWHRVNSFEDALVALGISAEPAPF